MSKSENPRFVFFLFIHSKRVAADFSLPRARCLPFPLCCLPRTRGALQCAIAFFFLSTRFATSLTFVFRSFSSASRIKREFSGLSADVDPLSSSTSSPCSSTRAPSALERKISLRRRGFRLYDSKGTSPKTTRPLPSSRRRRSAPHQHRCRKSENPRFVFFSFSFLTPNESRRPSPCRERVVYPPLFAVCRGFGGTPARHCFFSFSLRVLPPR